jgi:UDP-3-O-[3-hydroxymyristoyl] N-acetylglucosamine deacetylase
MAASRHLETSIRKTIAREFRLEGVALHSGKNSHVTLRPSSNGITISDSGRDVPLSSVEVVRTPRCTRLRLPSGRQIDMVEHLFAALRICAVSDIALSFSGDELPVLDGSAGVWTRALSKAGLTALSGYADCFVVVEAFAFESGMSRFTAEPGVFNLECTIDFPNPHIGKQSVTVANPTLASLADARTFVLEREIAMLQANNLALGGSLDNAVVIGEGGPLNPEGFRMERECARHKALDFLGDMMVLGMPIVGRFAIHAPGHAVNNHFLCEMLERGVIRRVSVATTPGLAAALTSVAA